MLKTTLTFALVALAVAVVPAPGADATNCHGGEDALLAIPYTPPGSTEGRYVYLQPGNTETPVSFWKEANGKVGLQPQDGWCGEWRFLRSDVNMGETPL